MSMIVNLDVIIEKRKYLLKIYQKEIYMLAVKPVIFIDITGFYNN
ncbi:hypothetical protein ACTPDI_10605 [Clostridioides difficile]|nr:hypothetical protein [Clostridioides difficile]